jgi:plastocyanin
MQRTRKLTIVIGVTAAVLLLAACSSSSSSSSTGATGGTETSPAVAGTDVQGKTTFAIDAQDFSFSPNALTGSPGQSLAITVTNKGSATHTFTIDSENVSVELAPGDSQKVTVTFPESGSVEFYCQFHVGSGMKGTLQVA